MANILTKVNKDIERSKAKLKKQSICENFGQKEVRALKDKYSACFYEAYDMAVINAISNFEVWAMDYAG